MSEGRGETGRPPKSAEELRSRITRISSANVGRHEEARQEALEAVLADRMRRRRHALVMRLRRMAVRGGADDLLRLATGDEPWAMTVLEIHRLLTQDTVLTCAACRYSLKGLMAEGTCPECGTKYRTGDVELAAVCSAIAEVLKMRTGSVRPEHQLDELLLASCLEKME
jgi:rubrerythrin